MPRKLLVVAAVFGAVALASSANATIVGSTYDFSTSSTGNTTVTGSPAMAYTDPHNPGFCVGPPNACGQGHGLSGSFGFASLSPTEDTISFSFYGSTSGAGPGSFSINLSNFATTDGETIDAISYASGNLIEGNFTSVSFNGTGATFTGSTGTDYRGYGGRTVVFDVATSTATAVPEPSSLALLGTALLGLGAMMRRRRQI